MVAIRLPDQRETAWILVRPSIWERIVQGLQHLREPKPDEKRAPLAVTPLPDVLPPQMQRRAEESLARLVALPELRTVLLINAQGTLTAWKGSDTQDTLQWFSSKLFLDISGHVSLANERELALQLGHQPQKASAAYGDKKAVLQELPGTFGGVMVAVVHRSGWRLVVIFAEKPARDLKEETHQSIRKSRQELSDILIL